MTNFFRNVKQKKSPLTGVRGLNLRSSYYLLLRFLVGRIWDISSLAAFNCEASCTRSDLHLPTRAFNSFQRSNLSAGIPLGVRGLRGVTNASPASAFSRSFAAFFSSRLRTLSCSFFISWLICSCCSVVTVGVFFLLALVIVFLLASGFRNRVYNLSNLACFFFLSCFLHLQY